MSTSNNPPVYQSSLSFRRNASRASEDILVGSPRMVMTPGGYNNGFYPSLTPFLISPNVGNGHNSTWGDGFNHFAY